MIEDYVIVPRVATGDIIDAIFNESEIDSGDYPNRPYLSNPEDCYKAIIANAPVTQFTIIEKDRLEQILKEIDQLKQQLKPTLFWDDNCPEEGYGDPEDCADYYDNEDEVIITIKQGVILPNNCYVAACLDKDGLQQKETCNTYEEAEAVIAKAKAVLE